MSLVESYCQAHLPAAALGIARQSDGDASQFLAPESTEAVKKKKRHLILQLFRHPRTNYGRRSSQTERVRAPCSAEAFDRARRQGSFCAWRWLVSYVGIFAPNHAHHIYVWSCRRSCGVGCFSPRNLCLFPPPPSRC